MGHALVALAISGIDPVQKVSIIPRGIGALGYTLQRPTDDRFLMGKQELEDKMTVLMGGRAVEILLGEDVSTGAADDLAKATDIARGMVLRFGMDDRLGPVAWDTEQGQFLNQPGVSGGRGSSATKRPTRSIRRCARTWKRALARRGVAILTVNRTTLNEGAASLLAHESLSAAEGEVGAGGGDRVGEARHSGEIPSRLREQRGI
jgi:cell division protease FtsH